MADPIVIVDARGTEHEFPAGFDPVKAAGIVKSQAGGTEPGDYNSGWWNSLKQQGKTLAQGAVNTLPAVGGIVGGVLSTPETMGAGTVLGGAVGAGVGRGARDLLAEWLQLEPKTSPASKAGRIALDMGTSAAAAKILPAVVEAAKTPGRTVGEILTRSVHPVNTVDELAQTLIKSGKGPAITPLVTEEFENGATILRDATTGRFATKAVTPAQPGSLGQMLSVGSGSIDSRISGLTPTAKVRMPANVATASDQQHANLLARLGGRGAPPTAAELELAQKLGQPGDAEMALAISRRNATGNWQPTAPSSSVRVPVSLNDAMAAAVRKVQK